jgi:hypothetical protein
MDPSVYFTPAMNRHRRFSVWQNPRGQWVAREGAGLIGGVFRSQRDALRFALFETGNPQSVVVLAGGARARAPH